MLPHTCSASSALPRYYWYFPTIRPIQSHNLRFITHARRPRSATAELNNLGRESLLMTTLQLLWWYSQIRYWRHFRWRTSPRTMPDYRSLQSKMPISCWICEMENTTLSCPSSIKLPPEPVIALHGVPCFKKSSLGPSRLYEYKIWCVFYNFSNTTLASLLAISIALWC
jgi:hypothetical protein